MREDTLIKPPLTLREELLAEAYDECEELARVIEEIGLPERLSRMCREARTVADILLAVEAVRGYVDEASAKCRGEECTKTVVARSIVETVKQIVEDVETLGYGDSRHTSGRGEQPRRGLAF